MSHGARLARLLPELVASGVVDAGAALAGRVTVSDLSRSNPVGLVSVDGAPVVVVKAASSASEEAACRLLAGLGVAPELVPCGGAALAFRPVLGARSLHEVASDALVGELGRLLRRVHGVRGGSERRPWLFDRDAPMWRWLDAGPAVQAAIAGLERAWTPRALLHGDVKFDNVLASDAGLLLVDWELAGRGEPAWDLAGVVDGLLLGHCAGGGAVDRSLALHVASPALAAYGPGVDADLVAVAAAARLAQTSAQMAAMGGEHEAAAPLVLTAAAGLAEDVLGVCTP